MAVISRGNNGGAVILTKPITTIHDLTQCIATAIVYGCTAAAILMGRDVPLPWWALITAITAFWFGTSVAAQRDAHNAINNDQ